MMKVAVAYYIWPNYRAGVIKEMQKSKAIEYTFVSSGDDYEGIPHIDLKIFNSFRHAPYKKLFGRLFWQPEVIRIAVSSEFDALILLADPNMLSTWVAAIIARLRRLPVIFWGHGWRKQESGLKRLFRQAFYRLSDVILVYSDRAKRLGSADGFPSNQIVPVYNSLDVESASRLINKIENGELRSVDPRSYFTDAELPLIICTARLIPACRFDELIKASAILEEQAFPINILLVGGGPEKEKLEILASKLKSRLVLYGPCFDEATVAQLIYKSDLTVSPGKIGLTAMHSLMYGTPAITHDHLDSQMPEVEAIEPGITGDLFKSGDVRDLAYKIRFWLEHQPSREIMRTVARDAIHKKWSPQNQARIIEEVVTQRLSNSKTPGHNTAKSE